MSFVLLGLLNSQAAGGGAPSDYSFLETVELTSNASSIELTNMVSTYSSEFNNLFVVFSVRCSSAGRKLQCRLNQNSVSGRSYWHQAGADGNVFFSPSRDSSNILQFGEEVQSVTNEFTSGIIDLAQFASNVSSVNTINGHATSSKHLLCHNMGYVRFEGSVDDILLKPISNDFTAGSRISLYGAK